MNVFHTSVLNSILNLGALCPLKKFGRASCIKFGRRPKKILGKNQSTIRKISTQSWNLKNLPTSGNLKSRENTVDHFAGLNF